MARVVLATALRPVAADAKEIQVSPGTLEEVLSEVGATYPQLYERIVDSAGVRRFVNIYLNDEDIRSISGLATEVGEDDVLMVIPAVAGGSTDDGSPHPEF
ncbi:MULTISPECIES: MoaD/ThiS family protein [Streptosporangium]|uniref:Molybdopterin converting factor small subunit n=1 Tax=Streptosporangium brasiliense TaxID=47480 RepID=A0ABT9R5Y2_9ACTN|nr:MoaD/ThiS family protein [Streptosporangium brasiliense]MDP9863840.1 molybdopterin converting factor small subunit [Streptosporangium brasiliense]